uniref:C2H2-type domain-containing protein n=1 Tax=Colletotrichum fructicola (strain Nara gc5) TaxID=1213859 RepID=L2FG85_COLFN
MSRRQIPPTLRTTRSPCTPDSLLAPTGRRFRSQIACMDSSSNNIPLDAQPSSPPGAASNSRPLASAPDSVALAPSDVLVASPITQQDQPASHLILASAPADRDDAAAAGLYQCPHCQRQYSRPAYLARHIRTYTFGKRCTHAAAKTMAASETTARDLHPALVVCLTLAGNALLPVLSRLSSTAAMHLTPPVCTTGGSWTQRSPDCLATPAPLDSHNNHSSWVAHQELSPPQQTACLTTDASSLATLGQHAEAGDGRPATLTTWRAGPAPDAAHVIHEISTYGWFATTGPVSNTMGRGVYEPEMGSVTVPEPETQPVSDLYASSSLELYVASLELFEAFKQPSLSGTNSADSQSWAWPADDAVDTM